MVEDLNRRERINGAAQAARQIELFTYREVSEAETPREVAESRALMRIAVGLRRKLESYRRS